MESGCRCTEAHHLERDDGHEEDAGEDHGTGDGDGNVPPGVLCLLSECGGTFEAREGEEPEDSGVTQVATTGEFEDAPREVLPVRPVAEDHRASHDGHDDDDQDDRAELEGEQDSERSPDPNTRHDRTDHHQRNGRDEVDPVGNGLDETEAVEERAHEDGAGDRLHHDEKDVGPAEQPSGYGAGVMIEGLRDQRRKRSRAMDPLAQPGDGIGHEEDRNERRQEGQRDGPTHEGLGRLGVDVDGLAGGNESKRQTHGTEQPD